MALDENIAALLTVPVNYYEKTGLDSHGQDVWASPVSLSCYPVYGQQMIQRRDGTVYTSQISLYFDGVDETVQGFKLGDKFTAPGIGGGMQQEAQRIVPTYSPGPSLGDPLRAWLVEVAL